MDILYVDGLYKSFDDNEVLHGIFKVREGEVVAWPFQFRQKYPPALPKSLEKVDRGAVKIAGDTMVSTNEMAVFILRKRL